jgi:tRNA nucleotidyltransferase (CCA-adding enzyme)
MLAAWLLTGSDLIRSRIDTYLRTWRHIHPETNGHTLREMGIRPGPCYRVILQNLKTARLDGEISQPQDEQQIIEQLLREEESCRDES